VFETGVGWESKNKETNAKFCSAMYEMQENLDYGGQKNCAEEMRRK